ncbi:MAG: hypothetical protein KAJ10_10985 [Thermodesulfovibrionia bacterium]|jgi:hypothetical protein|nr:hypothetical protein [Thermodesulfovibrionia bacterium]
MSRNKVVARFKDVTLIKGKTNNFSPLKNTFHVELMNGKLVKKEQEKLKVVKIDKEELKAAFFVKDFNGDKDRSDVYEDEIPGAGKKIEVEFNDGEIITGYTMSFSPERQGFFLVPADRKGNNERIFVVKSATAKMKFL